ASPGRASLQSLICVVFVSSISRTLLPAEVLSHPSIVGLVEEAMPSGTTTPDAVRRASEQAAIEPRHLRALLVHLTERGITVVLDVDDQKRAVAAASTRKSATSATAKKPAA